MKAIIWTGNEGFCEMKEKHREEQKQLNGRMPEYMRLELEEMQRKLLTVKK